jgi:hypothetical protein
MCFGLEESKNPSGRSADQRWRFAERSGREPSDTDGQPAWARERERMSQTPYSQRCKFCMASVLDAAGCEESAINRGPKS